MVYIHTLDYEYPALLLEITKNKERKNIICIYYLRNIYHIHNIQGI